MPTCFHNYEDSKTLSVCLSVCPYPEKRNHPGFVNISPTVVIDASMERSSKALLHGNTIFFFSKKFEIEFWLVFWLLPKSLTLPSFVNISPTLVIDTSMERSSQVLHHGNPKIWFKKMKLNFDLCQRAENNRSSRFQHEPIWRHRGFIFVPSRVYIQFQNLNTYIYF